MINLKPYAIDLFCGAGGMSEGILQAGFHIVFSSDINEAVEKTYTNRHEQLGYEQGINTFFKRADIRELTGKEIFESVMELKMFKGKERPQIDAIFGGPPCQGFSRAGLRKKDDPRNMLFKEYLRVIDEIRPKYVVMENVEGFTDTRLDGFEGLKGEKYPDNTLVPDILINEFDQIGYDTLPPQILDASDFGVPQRRKRVIFIAYLKGLTKPSYPTPFKSEKVTVLEAISDLIENPVIREMVGTNHQYQIDSKRGRTKNVNGLPIPNFNNVSNHDFSRHNSIIIERFSLYKEGESSTALIKRLTEQGINLKEYPSLLDECYSKLKDKYNKDQLIKMYKKGKLSTELIDALLTKKSNRFRYDKNGIAPTVVTLPDDYLVPFENRIPTVREMARLQSFDDSFIFLGKRTTGGQRRKVEVPQYTQVGNAVPPLLAKAIACEIIKVLKTTEVHLV